MGLQTPGPPEIIRSAQKDNDFIKRIQHECHEVIQNCFGQSFWMAWKNNIDYASVALYYVLTNLSGYQTLGEEYAGIVQVNNQKTKVPRRKVIVMMILCHTFGRSFLLYTLKLIENFLSKSRNPSSCHPQSLQGSFPIPTNELLALENMHNSRRRNWFTSGLTVTQVLQHYLPFLSQVHLAIFYLQGKFYHVAKRLTGIEYVLVRKWYANQNEGSKRDMKYLMWMSLVNLMLTAVQDSMAFIASQERVESTIKPERMKADEDPGIEASKKCSLCLELRKNPSVTTCGHLFCWSCIIDWLRTKQECPICREKVLPSRIVALGNYL